MLENDVSSYKTSLSIPVDSQPSTARQKNVAQGISKDNSDDEPEGTVSGPRQPDSIKLAATKNCM